MELRIKNIKRVFSHEAGAIFDISIESEKFFYCTYKSLWRHDDEQIFVSENCKELKLEKEVLVLDSLMELNPNSKASLSAIYKRAPIAYSNDERKKLIQEINEAISRLLFDISEDFSQSMSFDDTIDISKIMQIASFKYEQEDSASFFDAFRTFIKASIDACSYHYVVTRDLFSFMDEKDILNLKSELQAMGLTLLNFASHHAHKEMSNIERITIDSSLCEF